jgi:hypothetical protein
MARLFALALGASVAPKRLSYWPAINLRHVSSKRSHTAVYQGALLTLVVEKSHVDTFSVKW